MQWQTDLIADIRFNDPNIDDRDDVTGLFLAMGRHFEFTNDNHTALQKAISACRTPPKTF
jgi:hypothetical protein